MKKKARSVPALMDVARRAGVGAATVSRVINGGQNVGVKTFAAVQSVIAELGYHPSQAARSLKGARSKTIGLIVPSVADPFFSAAADAIQEVARQHGSLVLLATSDNLPGREREQVTTLIQRRIDGLILAPTAAAEVGMLQHASFPVVCFDRPFPGKKLPTVLSDNHGGAKAAGEYLLRQGRRRILCLAGDPKLFTSRRRVQGFREVMLQAGMPVLEELDVQDYKSAKQALKRHLAAKGIDAVFSIKNALTVHAYKALRELHVDVPEEVALLGFDDFDLADALDPPISVMRQQVVHLATRCTEMLFEMLENGTTRSRTLTLAVELVERGSTPPKS